MAEQQEFEYDVFLSHSSHDKPVVRELAERLKGDGLRVWLDDWVIQPGDMIGLKVEQGLESSRTLVLVMSQAAFDSEWVTLERHTALFRDPTNQQRRFIPLRIDDCDIKDLLKQFAYVDWRIASDTQYKKLLNSLSKEVSKPRVSDCDRPKQPHGEDVQWQVLGLRRMVADRVKQQFKIGDIVHCDDEEILFRAYDLNLERDVTLKVPNLPTYEANMSVDAFRAKMRAVSKLKHPNIQSVYGGVVLEQMPILILEYVPGLTLRTLIRVAGPQPLSRITNFLRHIASALEYAQRRRSVHCRLQPDNVMIDDEGEPVINPFRIMGDDPTSPLIRREDQSQLRRIAYQPPEFRDHFSPIASDQYSLGLIAYEMLIGSEFLSAGEDTGDLQQAMLAFSSNPVLPEHYGRECPNALWNVIKKMLHVSPKKRYQSLSDLRKAIDALTPRKLNLKSCNAHRAAAASLRRCRASPGLMNDFYAHLFQRCPALENLFHEQRLEQQRWALREALDLLLCFDVEPNGSMLLNKVAESHAREPRSVTANMYDVFVEALLDTVRVHDFQCRISVASASNVEKSWRDAIGPAIQFLKTKAADSHAK